jgi:hypothetical protein
VATLHLGDALDPEIAVLHPRVFSRVSNRKMGKPTPIPTSVGDTLARGVEREGARLHLVTSRSRIDEVALMLADADRLRFLVPEVHQAMMKELKIPGRDSLEEGLDVRSLEIDANGLSFMDLMRRSDVMGHLADWRAGQALGLRTRFAVESSSGVAVITIPRADPTWYVRAGAAMERFWLTADLHGLAVQPTSPIFVFATDEEDMRNLGGERYLNEMLELSDRFKEFWELAAGETIAMVLRVFHAEGPTVQSIRIPAEDLLSRDRGLHQVPDPVDAYGT